MKLFIIFREELSTLGNIYMRSDEADLFNIDYPTLQLT